MNKNRSGGFHRNGDLVSDAPFQALSPQLQHDASLAVPRLLFLYHTDHSHDRAALESNLALFPSDKVKQIAAIALGLLSVVVLVLILLAMLCVMQLRYYYIAL